MSHLATKMLSKKKEKETKRGFALLTILKDQKQI